MIKKRIINKLFDHKYRPRNKRIGLENYNNVPHVGEFH
jgi:hypothetical protein